MNKFVALKQTILYNNVWHCADVPYKILFNDDFNIILLPFNGKTKLQILKKDFEKYLYELKTDETFIYINSYPNKKIPILEFNIEIISINNLKKYFSFNKNILHMLKKIEHDALYSKGNRFCITIKEYNKYKLNIDDNKNNKLIKIGSPIFNRSSRHSPPISNSFTRIDFEKSHSFPAPIGIHESDFSLPSEQNKILIELLNQFFSCKNAPKCPEEIIENLNLNIKENSHKCLWCGVLLDISELNQSYCSSEHSINICHRNPEFGTNKDNIYLGHCSCNRQQGGYSEEQRIDQIIRLVKANEKYKKKILQELL